MKLRRNWLVLLIMVMGLTLAACTGGGPATNETETGEETSQEQPATDGAEAPAGDGAEAPATEAPATEAPATEAPTDLTAEDVRELKEIESIESYRVRMTIEVEGEAFETEEVAQMGNFTIEGAFVKNPPAQHIMMKTGDESAGFGNIEVIQIEDQVFTNFNGQWIQSTSESVPNMDDFTFLSPSDIGEDFEQMERVGTEEVNGRNTIHLRADRELMLAMAEEDNELSLENADTAQVDIWVDEAEGFIVKMSMLIEGQGINSEKPEASGRMQLVMENFDFNGDIQITAPESAGTGLQDLLGFDLQLPEGSEMSLATPTFAQFTVPMTMDEARSFVEQAMTGAGFALDLENSAPDYGSFSFKMGDKTLSVILSEADGATSVMISQDQ